MKRILSLSLAFAILFFPTFRADARAQASPIVRYLILGFDDAAANTDAIAVVSYHSETNRLSILQIPRDTYCRFGGEQNKLNQLYPHVLSGRSDKQARQEAAQVLCATVSSILGVAIDYYVGVSIADFSRMIDLLGGVEVTLARDLVYRDDESGELVTLAKGKRVLSGKDSAAFVRYRVGYVNADLGRIDAQKLFVSAFLQKFCGGVSFRSLSSILMTLHESAVTNMSVPYALRIGLQFVSSYRKTEIWYLTLPGEPCMYRQISYFIANRASASEAVQSYLCFSHRESDFDPKQQLVLDSSPKISEIYRRNSVSYRVYTDAELRLGS